MIIQLEGDPISCGDLSGPEAHHVFFNGRRAALVGTLSTGGCGLPPTAVLQSTQTFVFVDGIPVVIQGDQYQPQVVPPVSHPVRTALGSDPFATIL